MKERYNPLLGAEISEIRKSLSKKEGCISA